MNTDFQTAFESFIAGCNRIVQDANLSIPTEIRHHGGRKYAKLVRFEQHGDGEFKPTSVHCFVDTTNGDVLKAASYKAPAKHARGNIFDKNNGLASMRWTGPAYLR